VIDTSKWRVPAGSLAVDGALVVSLVWAMGSMTEQLNQMSDRINEVEQREIMVQSEPRLRVLERRADEMVEFKAEVRAQLDRIEEKLDRAIK
jgi:uncharacterized membrane protein